MDDSDPRVIPAKAGIQPRLIGLVIAAGFLVLVGGGCNNTALKSVSDDAAWKMSGIKFDDLVFEDQGSYSQVQGVEVVCSLENAQILFPSKDENWAEIAKMIQTKEKEGWGMKKFCYDRNGGSGFIMEKENEKKVFLMGVIEMARHSVLFSEPFELSTEGIDDGRWKIEAMLQVNEEGYDNPVPLLQATVSGDNLAYSWRETIAFDGSTIRKVETCSNQIHGIPPEMKITIPKPCK